MPFTIKIEPDASVLVWAVHLNGRPVIGFNEDNEAPLYVEEGENRLTYEVRGSGSSLAITVLEEPPFIDPPDATWPFEVQVPGDRTVAYDALYFAVL